MQAIKQIPHTLDEALAQITEILARGYMRYEKNRRLGSDTKCQADVTQAEESEAVAEKPLDSSGHRSVHAFPG
jgi:hypothetical protein